MGRKSRQKKAQRPAPPRPSRPPIAILLGLTILTLAVFGQVISHQFLNYDDGQFVTQNPNVAHGLTASSIGWAVTSTSIGWYPTTWLSHMLDIDLWGLDAGKHLLTNVVLHLLSTCVLFLALQRMTGATWPSAVVAAIFAVHPMHVESVAWVSERKDTLSTFFIMLALLTYAGAPRRRLSLFVLMALSLMAKQMYITFPFLLLLIDFWPLQRRDFMVGVVEKIPLFGLSVFGAVMAVIGQRNLNTLQSVQALPMATRLANASVAYLRYIGKFFVPANLAVLYPLQPIGASVAFGALILLIAISAAAFVYRHTAPYAFTGWFWFIGTLVPVIGIVQIGPQAIADRYSYFAYIGLSIVVVWSALHLAQEWQRVLAVAAVMVILALAVMAFLQVGYWRDSATLFQHTIAVTPPNPIAEYSLGQTLEMTEPDRSIAHLRRALELVEKSPGAPPAWHAQAYVGLGTATLMKAHAMPHGAARTATINDAVAQYQHALSIDPNAEHARNNIALAQRWLRER